MSRGTIHLLWPLRGPLLGSSSEIFSLYSARPHQQVGSCFSQSASLLHLGLFTVSNHSFCVSTPCQPPKFLITVGNSQVGLPFIYIWLRYSCTKPIKNAVLLPAPLGMHYFQNRDQSRVSLECGSCNINKTDLSIVYYHLGLFTQRAE